MQAMRSEALTRGLVCMMLHLNSVAIPTTRLLDIYRSSESMLDPSYHLKFPYIPCTT